MKHTDTFKLSQENLNKWERAILAELSDKALWEDVDEHNINIMYTLETREDSPLFSAAITVQNTRTFTYKYEYLYLCVY